MRLLRDLMRPAAIVLMIALVSSSAFAASRYGKHPVLVPKPPLGAWKTDFTSGVATLASGDRPTLLMVSISSDPACREAKQMLADPAVQQSLAKWNLLYDDTDCYARFEKVLWYRTVPFFIMFDKDGNEISRCGGEMNAKEFNAWIDQVYRQCVAGEMALARIKTYPNERMLQLGAYAGTRTWLALKMYNADIRFAVSMPERLDRAIAANKQFIAAGPAKSVLDGDIKTAEFDIDTAEAVNLVLRGRLGEAAARLDQLDTKRKDFGAFSDFWRIYIKMVRNCANPIRNHDPESDELFKQYVKKYPKSFYTDTARRRIETINAEIEKEKADSQ